MVTINFNGYEPIAACSRVAIKIRRKYLLCVALTTASLLSTILKTTREQLKLKRYLCFVEP